MRIRVQRYRLPDLHPHGVAAVEKRSVLYDCWTKDTYTKEGLEWVEENSMATVLRRHFPNLKRRIGSTTTRSSHGSASEGELESHKESCHAVPLKIAGPSLLIVLLRGALRGGNYVTSPTNASALEGGFEPPRRSSRAITRELEALKGEQTRQGGLAASRTAAVAPPSPAAARLVCSTGIWRTPTNRRNHASAQRQAGDLPAKPLLGVSLSEATLSDYQPNFRIPRVTMRWAGR